MSRLLLLAPAFVGVAPEVVVEPPPEDTDWSIAGASDADTNLATIYSANLIVVNDGSPQETGYRPAAAYNALWTRDHAYVLWHNPNLLTSAERQDFVTYTLSRRTNGSESDPDGGTLPADWIADRIDTSGNATYKNAGASDLPFMDGIAFVVLALWADWNETADDTTFLASQSAIEDCIAALPRSGNGCVYSDPGDPSVDYGFCDTVKKTGDVAYGTALLAWAYKMMIDMGGSYATEFQECKDGLATLRQSSGWYAGSSVNNAAKDDVWATALAVAEDLIDDDTERLVSAQTIADAYVADEISQFGLVRHLPVGQFWAGTSTSTGTYQNGGFWATPVWDCVRAVDLVDSTLALAWAGEFIQQIQDEHTAEGSWGQAAYEWHNFGVGVGAKGYTASAAVVHRFI